MEDTKAPTTQPNNMISIQANQYDSLYEHIVKPDRALYLPGYFKRWIKYLGPDLAWMYASFRQAAYMDGARDGAITSRFTVAEIARRAGITERTFWNRACNPATWDKLKGLVARIDEDPKWDISSGIPKQLPRKFTVAMTVPLTSTDTTSLRKWLLSNMDKYNGAEGSLRAAASAPVAELLPLNAEHNEQSEPMTVRQLLHRMYGDIEPKLLDALASAIQNNIMPSNDQIKITIFFMEHILAHLGSGAGWIVTLLRDKCFENGTETRNRVVVTSGYAEIADWLGISRVKTVWEWLNQKKNDLYLNPVLRVYLRENLDERNYDKHERTFHVLLDEIPNEMLEALVTEKGLTAELLANGADFERIISKSGFGGNFSLGMADFSVTDGAIFSHALAGFSAHLGGFFSHGLADFTAPFGGFFRVKNSLTPPENSKTPPTQPTAAEEKITEAEQPAQSNGRAGWSFSQIAQGNSINPKSKKDLRDSFPNEQILSQKFIAWILYAYSPLGKGLTDATGVSKAIKSLCSPQPEFAPRKFEMLARLGAQKLQELFDCDYARKDPGKSIEAKIYEANFKKLDPLRKSELYFALFGKDNPQPATKPVIEQQKTAYQIRLAEIKARGQIQHNSTA